MLLQMRTLFILSFIEVVLRLRCFYRVCIQEYFRLVLCWEICPLSECPLLVLQILPAGSNQCLPQPLVLKAYTTGNSDGFVKYSECKKEKEKKRAINKTKKRCSKNIVCVYNIYPFTVFLLF